MTQALNFKEGSNTLLGASRNKSLWFYVVVQIQLQEELLRLPGSAKMRDSLDFL